MTEITEAAPGKTKAMGRPVGSSREASLERILPAARKLFANTGYAKTTFKEVGKAVGMTHAALYGYFPSKAALMKKVGCASGHSMNRFRSTSSGVCIALIQSS